MLHQLYDQTHFVEHQISTYNDFITRGVQAIVNKEPPIEINNIRVEFNRCATWPLPFIRKAPPVVYVVGRPAS